jgi:hypothetical protein
MRGATITIPMFIVDVFALGGATDAASAAEIRTE